MDIKKIEVLGKVNANPISNFIKRNTNSDIAMFPDKTQRELLFQKFWIRIIYM